MDLASAEAEIRHVFGDTPITEASIGAAPPDILVKLSARSMYDVIELIRPNLFSPGYDIKKPNFFAVFEAQYLWKYLSVRGMVHIIRTASSRRIFEKLLIRVRVRVCIIHC